MASFFGVPAKKIKTPASISEPTPSTFTSTAAKAQKQIYMEEILQLRKI